MFGPKLFFAYSVVNMLTSCIIAIPMLATTVSDAEKAFQELLLGFFLKFVIIPVMGVMAFGKMIYKDFNLN